MGGGNILEKENHILVVFPHPDDEAFSIAGTLALYINAGIPVTYMCLTLGQMGQKFRESPLHNERGTSCYSEARAFRCCSSDWHSRFTNDGTT